MCKFRMEYGVVPSEKLAGLGAFPGGIVIEREYLLYAFGPAAALVVEDFQGAANPVQTRIVFGPCGVMSSADAVEDCGQVEELAAGFEEVSFQGLAGGQRR